MSTNITLKRSSVQGKVPLVGDLSLGEIAINTYDGKLYIKKNVGGTESIVDISGGGGAPPSLDAVTTIGNTTTNDITVGNINLPDNGKATFGAGSDLQIYHDGSNSYVHDTGVGSLILRATNFRLFNAGETKVSILANDGGETSLYHDGSKKIATTATGIDVTGTVTADGLTVDGDFLVNDSDPTPIVIQRNGGTDTNSSILFDQLSYETYIGTGISGDFVVGATADLAASRRFAIAQNGDISFYEDTGTTPQMVWDASADALTFGDNVKATFGAGSDLQIYHSGADSIILDNGTGNLEIRADSLSLLNAAGSEYYARFYTNGAANLYHDGNLKLNTTSTGIDVTGTVTADGLTVDGSATINTSSTALANFNYIGANKGSITTDGINLKHNATANMYFNVNSANRMLIGGNGDISFYEDTGTTAKFFWDASAESLIVDNRIKAGTTADGVSIGSASGKGEVLGVDTAGNGWNPLDIRAGSSTQLYLNTDGNVGIGTASPSAALDIEGLGNTVAAHIFTSDNVSNATASLVFGTTPGARTKASIQMVNINTGNAEGALAFSTNSGASLTERMRIDGSGNVGIGTNNPQYKFDVYGTDDITMRVHRPSSGLVATDTVGIGFSMRGDTATSSSDTRAGIFSTYNGNIFLATDAGGNLNSNPGDYARLYITGTGNVGIGTSSPATTLDVKASNAVVLIDSSGSSSGIHQKSTSGEHRLLMDSSGFRGYDITNLDDTFTYFGGASGYWRFFTNGTESLRITSTGSVGIGTASPSSALQVVGTVTATAFSGPLTGAVTGNASTATTLQTARAIQVSGAVTGTANFDGSAAINIVTTATSDPTLTLAGDATGSATFTNLGNATLTVAVVDDSHSHSFNNLINKTGGTGDYTTTGTFTGATFNATSTAGGGFQGIDADTAAIPSFTWTSDQNTGMWHSGTDAIGFTTAGVNRAQVTNSGLKVESGGIYNTVIPEQAPISDLTLTTGGTGFTDGTYANVAITGGTYGLMTVVVAGGIVTSVTLTNPGYAYTSGVYDISTQLTGAGSGATVTISTQPAFMHIYANPGIIRFTHADSSSAVAQEIGSIRFAVRDASTNGSGDTARIVARSRGSSGGGDIMFQTTNNAGGNTLKDTLLLQDGNATFYNTASAGTFNATSTVGGGFQGIDADTAAIPSFTWTSDLNTGIWHAAADSIGFTTGGTNRLTLSTTALTSTVGVSAPTFTGALTGNATTATTLATTRAIQLSGAVTGTANFDGSAAINIVTTATSDPVLTLAGDATGSATFTNLGNATLTVAVVDDSHNHSSSSGNFTVNGILTSTANTVVQGSLQIDGDLTVSGNTVTVSASNLAIEDSMIYLNSGSTVANPDLGFAGNYNDGTYAHAGFFRDATDGYFKPFKGYTPEPDASAFIDTSHASFALADIQAANFRGALIGNATTATTLQTARTIALSGDVTGSASFNGSANITITAAVADNSHNHSSSSGDFSVGGNLTIDGFGNNKYISFRTGYDATNVGIRAKAITTANRDGLELLGYNGIDFSINNGSTVAMHINGQGVSGAGNVGIGTVSPSNQLSVGNNILSVVSLDWTGDNASKASISANHVTGEVKLNAVANYFPTFYSNGSERLRIDTSGNLLVGKTIADNTTQGIRMLGSVGFASFVRSGAEAIVVNRLSDDGDLIEFRKDGTTVGSIGTFNGDTVMGTGLSAVRFNDGVPAISPHRMDTNNTHDASTDLGQATVRFKDLYLSGGLRGDTLTFSNLAGTERMRIDSSGNVGIGTNSPADKLSLEVGAANQGLSIYYSGTEVGSFRNDAGNATLNANNANLKFETGGTERMRIDSSGRLGIGTTSITQLVEIASAGATNARISSTGGSGAGIKLRSGGSYDVNLIGNVDTFQIQTNNAERFRIVSNGNVGIGTNAPGYKLEVNGSFAATTKSFVIDHPTKPDMKLRYGSLEGPEDGVYVRGRLKDNNVIELPDYWTGLVHEDSITVNLTAIGRGQDIWVEDIVDNTVIVGGDNVNCFYTVFATRKDVEKFDVEYDV